MLAVPLSLLVPKTKGMWLFIGGGDGQFRDNVKYLFLHLYKQKTADLKVYFLTENRLTYEDLNLQGLPVILYPRVTTVIKMLRASVVIVDNFTWIGGIKYHLLLNSCKVQL